MNIYFSIRDLRDMLTEPSEYYGASEFLYKDKNHDWNLNLENIINRLRTFQRSLYEIIEFVENFKRNNKND
ncbi:MAG TPA: hypothetical protein VKR58_04775, partial [Aquella sp.]|nr:hypothetical protein [Aquella sp.]